MSKLTQTLRVIVVEDEVAARAHLMDCINDHPEMELVTAASNYEEGIASLKQPHDVLVVDIGLPDGSGIDIIRHAKRSCQSHCLVTTVFADEQTVVSALEAGADGYVLKEDERLGDSIVTVAQGHVPLTPSIAVHLLRRFRPPKRPTGGKPLTKRENEVLSLLARGHSYQDIANSLAISQHTVTDHVKAIYKKLAVNSRSSAVYQGLKTGLIQIDDPIPVE